jgi:hypothetical protein
MDLYRAIVKMEEGGAADGVLKVHHKSHYFLEIV